MARHYRLYWVMLLVLLLGGFVLAQQPQQQNPTQQPSPASQNPSTPETTTPGTESNSPRMSTARLVSICSTTMVFALTCSMISGIVARACSTCSGVNP